MCNNLSSIKPISGRKKRENWEVQAQANYGMYEYKSMYLSTSAFLCFLQVHPDAQAILFRAQ